MITNDLKGTQHIKESDGRYFRNFTVTIWIKLNKEKVQSIYRYGFFLFQRQAIFVSISNSVSMTSTNDYNVIV